MKNLIKIAYTLILGLFIACSSDSVEDLLEDVETPDVTAPTVTIWDGDRITFTKENFADPTLEENQDRITDNVWITRGDNSSIYNAVSQSSGAPNPDDTRWAFGTTDDLETLTFDTFQNTHGNKTPEVLDRDMVLHLVTDDIYIDIMFTSWIRLNQGGGGGFSYTRTTE